MIRGILEGVLRQFAPQLVDGLTKTLNGIADPTSSLFGRAAVESTTWSSIPGLLGIVATLGFLVLSFVTAMALVDVPSWVFEKVTSYRATRLVRRVMGLGIVALVWLLVDEFDPIATGERLRDDTHTLLSLFAGTNVDVGLHAMVWGVTNNPLLEFVGLAVIALMIGTVTVYRHTGIPALWVFLGTIVTALGMTTVAAVAGLEVFPLQLRWAFLFAAGVLWAVFSLVIWALDRFAYELQYSTPLVDEGDLPHSRYVAFDALILLVVCGLMGNVFSGFLAWLFWRFWRVGGWQSLKQKYNSPSRAPDPEPQEPTNES